MLYEELKTRKQELGLTTEQLSQFSGVPVGTINKILNGETKSPRCDTLNALTRVLFEDTSKRCDFLQDSPISYNVRQQEDYTISDYYNLPDNIRAELIDGKLIYMEAPSFTHQELITALVFEIESYIRSFKGPCKVLAAPLDVQLDNDDKTIVQPDIVITCRKDNRTPRGICGAPDMCIEITSDSTRKRDFGLKMLKYMNAGVREYWIVDPKRENIICYFFEGDVCPVIYTFNDTVPVLIYDSALKIDFAVIKKRLDY